MKNWNELLEHEVQDLYDAEKQLIEALPKLAQKASSPELKMAFEEHLAETEIHAQRLEQAAQILGIELGKITCEGMKGLIKEGEMVLKERGGDPEVVDAALIGAAQKVEHYEMAAYDDVLGTAEKLGMDELADLFLQTLEEEMAASDKLSEIAESGEDEELLDGEDQAAAGESGGGRSKSSKGRGRSASRGSGSSSKRSGNQQRGDDNMASNSNNSSNSSNSSNERPRDSEGRFISEDEAQGGSRGGGSQGSSGGSSSGGGSKGGSGGGSSSGGGSKGGSGGGSSSGGGSKGGSGGGR